MPVTTEADPAQPAATPKALTPKARRTRAQIVDAGLRLFSEHGYDGATMRAVAKEAGVSMGNAYYYFPSKEHLIHGFYAQCHVEHEAAARIVLDTETRLEARLEGVLLARFESARPHKEAATGLFRWAADPRSPLSPFSPESEPVRADATALLARVLDGTKISTRTLLGKELPGLLWYYEMALMLFWVHDRSPDQERTMRLTRRTVPIICKLIRLGSHPLLAPVVRPVLRILAEFREPVAGETPRAQPA